MDEINGGRFFCSEPGRFKEISVGVDFGGSKSAHAFVAVGMRRADEDKSVGGGEKALVALVTWRVAENFDPIGLYCKITEFLRFVYEKYGVSGCIMNLWCDSAEPVLIRGLRKAVDDCALPFTALVRAARKRRILDRVRGTLTLMAQGRFFYTEDCGALVGALKTAVWRSDGERLDDGTTDIDTLDAFEYAWERELERMC